MIRSLMWKEYREQRAIWLTLAVVGGTGLYGLSRLMAPEGILGSNGARESLQTVAVLFAWTYGLVCGAMLLANENEAGTMTFLDILPARRRQLWLVKYTFALLLLLTQVAVLAGFVVALDITETRMQTLATLAGMLLSGLVALSWSVLFSALGENVLNVIGFSFVGQIVGAFVTALLLFPVAILLTVIRGPQPDEGGSSRIILACLGALTMTAGPLLGSVRVFTRLDRERRERARAVHGPGPARHRWYREWASWGRLVWLSYAQMRRLLLGLSIFSLALGLVLPFFGPAAWPSLTLLLGVLCGVTVWGDEQQSAAFRFLGDQRFPLGRVWIVKVSMRFALAVFAAFLLLLPSLVVALIHQMQAESQVDSLPFTTPHRIPFFADLLHSNLVGPIVPIGTHLSMWLLYGFTAGHLCGLLFRKSLVAAVVALGSAGMLACVWIPSLVGIGLHFWQVAGVPLVLLVAGWLLMPAWTADRLLARGTFVRLGVVLLAAGLWIAGSLWYRVAEIPDVPDAFDIHAFAAEIPSLDPFQNPAGLEIHSAWHEVEQLSRELRSNNALPHKPLFPGKAHGFHVELLTALEEGWPPNRRSDLGDRLDAQFRKEWYGHVVKAADGPLGIVEDAKLLMLNNHRSSSQWQHLESLNQVLAVRGLQMQASGDHGAFVDQLRISLALSRNVQNHAPLDNVRIGRQAELICVEALDRWLEKLPGHPELLERVRDILLQHETQLPEENDVLQTAYLITLNTLKGMPEKLVELEISGLELGGTRNQPLGNVELQKAELDLVRLLWYTPWEHERHQRILRVIFGSAKAPDPWQRRQAARWGGSMLCNLDLAARHEKPRDKRQTAFLHAAQLKVALRLYQAKHGKLPRALDELVQQRYLPALPRDPFDRNQLPLRYRKSRDKGLWSAVVWSVGEDGNDDGGWKDGAQKPGFNPHTSLGEDLLYRVPPPPR